MPLTDPLGDMLTRIRNGQQARKDSVLSPASKLRARVLDVLQREGYIRGYREEPLGAHPGLRIELKYFEGQPAIQHVARVSKPGRRVYSGAQELPRVRNGLGISIIPSQAAASDVKAGQLFRSRIAGHSLVRQTGWLYPKMSRLPRTVSEVIRIFETIRPRLQAATRVK